MSLFKVFLYRINALIIIAAQTMLTGCIKDTIVKHPNVVLIMTDDQGYGDLGYHGNLQIKTPVLDSFAEQSTVFENFFVCPVCAPTRSSLMTGRYSLRTGIRDTYNGGAIMATEEVTIAEMLKQADYKTGIFGKWHLGDNYPSRPMDQGFDESVIHLSGGMGQVGDITSYFRYDSSYFDPVLWHNGKQESYQGYCSDIFTDQALKFIDNSHSAPFFCYLSFNAPHTPLQVPEEYYMMYSDIDPSSGYDRENGLFPDMNERDKEDARKVYAMVSNIDDNVGRVLDKLDELGIEDNTIVIFMTDNGPQQPRYVGGMRGRKGSVYRGGVRVPFFLRYPAMAGVNSQVSTNAAHIDVLPTLAELCGVEKPGDRKIDGKSLAALIKGEGVKWGDRPLFFYWTRKYPELYRNMAVQSGNFKLVGNTDFNSSPAQFELYNIGEDPGEQINISKKETGIAEKLKSEIDNLYKELINSENIVDPPRIVIGSDFENPVILNRNDADGERGMWAQEEIFGFWRVKITGGSYKIIFKFLHPLEPGGRMILETGAIINQQIYVGEDSDIIEFNYLKLPEMECDLIPFYQVGSKKIFPFWVEIEKQ